MSGRARRPARKRAAAEEEHENHERWMISYADMLTLLFVLFVVLFAMSQLDQAKFNALKASLAMGFGEQSAAFTGRESPMDGQSAPDETLPVDLNPAVVGDRPAEQRAAEKKVAAAAVSKATQDRLAAQRAAARREIDDFKRVRQMILDALKKNGVNEQEVRFAIDQRGLVVTVLTSEVVFPSGSAELLTTGRKIIDSVGPPLRTLPNHIEIDGHTNKLPISSAQYPSNWELATARATTVLRYLISAEKLPAARLSAAGFADQRPLYDYGDSRAMRLNRRVEIVVLSTLSSEERAHLPYVAAEEGS